MDSGQFLAAGVTGGYEISVRQRGVIIGKLVGGGGTRGDLKELKARLAADLGGLRAVGELLAVSYWLLALAVRRIPLRLRVGGRPVVKRSCAKGGSLSGDRLVAVRQLSI